MVNQRQPIWWPHSSESWHQLSHYFAAISIIEKSCWKKISHGIANYNYQLVVSDRLYFVQLINQDNLALLPQANGFPDLTQLVIFSKLNSWLAPCLFLSPLVRIFNWVDSPIVNVQTISTAAYQRSFLIFLTTLHSEKKTLNTTSKTLPSVNIVEHLSHYQTLASQRYSDSHKILSSINVAVDQAIELSTDFSATTFCHNDLSLSNQLWDKQSQQLTILDWEYACFNDPIFELANYFNALQLNENEQLSFIKEYQRISQIPVDLNKLKNMKKLATITNFVWELLSN